jgi:succinate dehydrogenase / fumarate reductase cytochrome b subunit
MLSSILHRASAIICYIGLVKVAIGLLIVAITGRLPLEGLIFSPLGAIGLFVFLFAFIFMALAQLRHAIWDKGAMLDPAKNNVLSYVMIFAALALAALGTYFAGGAA